MDHEKSRKAESSGMTIISGDLFQEPRQLSSRGNVWKIAFFVLIAVLISTAAVSVFFMRQEKHAKSDAVLASSEQRSPIISTSTPSATHEKIVGAEQSSPHALVPDLQSRKEEETSRRVDALSGDGGSDEISNELTPDKLREIIRAAPVTQTSAPMEITVSGIAWQDERKARRAVVNGLLAREGSVVAGATIREIMKDRVRFSRAGATFDVIMNTAGDNPAAQTGSGLPND